MEKVNGSFGLEWRSQSGRFEDKFVLGLERRIGTSVEGLWGVCGREAWEEVMYFGTCGSVGGDASGDRG